MFKKNRHRHQYKFGNGFLRYPKTFQERKANMDKNDNLVRGKRKNLPTEDDELRFKVQKSWKSRRKNQYNSSKNFCWHEFYFDWSDKTIAKFIVKLAVKFGFYYEEIFNRNKCCLRWYGTNLTKDKYFD